MLGIFASSYQSFVVPNPLIHVDASLVSGTNVFTDTEGSMGVDPTADGVDIRAIDSTGTAPGVRLALHSGRITLQQNAQNGQRGFRLTDTVALWSPETATTMGSLTEATLFWVGRTTYTDPPGGGFVFSPYRARYDGSNGETRKLGHVFHFAYNQDGWVFSPWGNTGTSAMTLGVLPSDTAAVVAMRASATDLPPRTLSIRADGLPLSSQHFSNFEAAYFASIGSVECNRFDNTGVTGMLYELLVYPVGIPPRDTDRILQQLQQKWGIV